MKTKYIAGVLGLLLFIGERSSGQINQAQADSIVKKYINQEIQSEYLLYFYIDTISAEPGFPYYAYAIDEAPFAYGMHPCRCISVNRETGEMKMKHFSVPLSPWIGWQLISGPDSMQAASSPLLSPAIKSLRNSTPKTSASQDFENYAIILNGGKDSQTNILTAWEDCAFLYTTLIHVYGYRPENVHILISDGTNPNEDMFDGMGFNFETGESFPRFRNTSTDLDGDGKADTRYSATKANLTQVFNTLAQQIGADDNLFVFIANHGNVINGEYFCTLWHDSLSARELANELDKIHAETIAVLMQPCHSGGFIPYIKGENRVIMTACTAEGVSHPSQSVLGAWSEFSNLWTEAMAGMTRKGHPVDADSDKDGVVSMEEAFLYAKELDREQESPQYNSIPTDLGKKMGLFGYYSLTELRNAVISQDKTIHDRFIQVSNTRIKKGAKLTLDHTVSTKLEYGFTMEAGSELEIK